MWKLLVISLLLVLSRPASALTRSSTTVTPASRCAGATLPIKGNQIWVDLEGEGGTTVVFEAGFGNDSMVWSRIAARVRSLGVRTFVYDRAGMGKSSIDTSTPYSLDNDVSILSKALDRCGVQQKIVVVAHSYGGAIGLVLASRTSKVEGLVLLDAVVPGVWTREEVSRNLSAMRPQYDDIRKSAPDLAKVAIPWAEAMPATANQVNALHVSETLPIIDIKAENGETDPKSASTWLEAHLRFTQGHAERKYVLAKNSSHKIMVDQPDLVTNSIAEMIAKVRRP